MACNWGLAKPTTGRIMPTPQPPTEALGPNSMIAFTDDACRLWGKSRGLDTPYPLLAHLLDTAATAQIVVNRLVPASLARTVAAQMGVPLADWAQTVKVLAGWHDMGKASCGFQNYDRKGCPSWLAGSTDAADAGRHDTLGACLVWDRLNDRQARYRASQIVGGHHGTIPSPNRRHLRAWGGAGLVDADPPARLIEARRRLWEVLDSSLGELPDPALPDTAASTILAIVVLSDWIASSQRFLREQQTAFDSTGLEPLTHLSRAQDLAAAHLDHAGLAAPKRRLPPTTRRVLGPSSLPQRWTALQESIDSLFSPSGPGIAVICAPTGEGKTEAALLAALRLSDAAERHGLFFAMPTIATAEGLHDRLVGVIERTAPEGSADAESLRRVHSQAVLYNDGTLSTVSDDTAAMRAAALWMSGTRKAMLAPFGIGTVDQVLLGALKAKHSPLRLFGAALGTLVLDEAHALDPYMRMLLVRAVEWLAALGTPVVVLSATMPRKRISELVAAYQAGARLTDTPAPADVAQPDLPPAATGYPMWAAWTAADGWTAASTDPRRSWTLRLDVEDTAASGLTEQIAIAAVEAAAAGECVLVVRSTVRDAQDTYEAVRRLDPTLRPGETVEILHSRMSHSSRRVRSMRLMAELGPDPCRRPKRLVLIATQVVEQSLDVDFDLLVTDPAPIPVLLQRAGRVRRHRPPPDGQPVAVRVLWPLTSNGEPHQGSPIYSRADLMAARTCLTQASSVRSLTVQVPADVPDLVERADPEGAAQFEFDDADANEAEEATLAQLVRIDGDMSEGLRWAIPAPGPDSPLSDLTGLLDSDEHHPGTRHRARSVLVVPAYRIADGWSLRDGTQIDPHPRRMPDHEAVKAVFDAAIPVSYPNSAWVDELESLDGAWDRTPVAAALLLDTSGSKAVTVGGYSLRAFDEIGLAIRSQR